MGKILITGSTDGLGLLAARSLASQGHTVVLHARTAQRARHALQNVPTARHCLIADLADQQQVRRATVEANQLGPFTAVIHNAGVFQSPSSELLAVNLLAPYLLTCLINKPDRLIYLGSNMHMQGSAHLGNLLLPNPPVTYSDTKLYLLMLCKAVARQWPQGFAATVDPGWVPTKMGGPNAPDDLQKGWQTQAWLATCPLTPAQPSGQNYHHQRLHPANPLADDPAAQMQLLDHCARLTGETLPA